MRASVLTEILDRLERSNLDAAAKREAKAIVQTTGRQHGVKQVDQFDRIEFAQQLMAAKISRPTIRDRLMARYDLSRRQAYRVIHSALTEKQEVPGST
jgi:hypothetical protein